MSPRTFFTDAAQVTSVGRAFVDHVRSVSTTSELRGIMEAVTRELGFRHFALIHHDDLRAERPGLININNYPEAWVDRFIEQQLYLVDPVVHACLRRNEAFSWSDLPRLLPLNARHRTLLAAAAREGLEAGITVPACVPGERTGSCSFGGAGVTLDPSSRLPLAQFIGAFGFAAARRIASTASLSLRAHPRLTPRQRECIVLVGQGKTDWEIATILALSRVTVKHYLDDARRLYDIPSRTQLVIRALLDGEVSFTELAPVQYVHMAG